MSALARRLAEDVRELAEAFHQVGSLRDHADPNDNTGWNVHGIETCEDVYCMNALAVGKDIAAIEAEAAVLDVATLTETMRSLDARLLPGEAEGYATLVAERYTALRAALVRP